MAASIFDDRSQVPTLGRLDEALGESAALFRQIGLHILEQTGELDRQWKYYGRQAGWTLAVASRSRRVFHLVPKAGYFVVVFTFGKAAVEAAQASDLPESLLDSLATAREYPEGRSLTVDVATAADAAVVERLIDIKLAH